MEYIKKIPNEPSFSQNGLDGFRYKLETKDISISAENVYKGHEKYCKNLVSTSIYYIAEGTGVFKIENNTYNVTQGDLVEIPPNTEFVFVGKMKLLFISTPAFKIENDVKIRDNDLYE